ASGCASREQGKVTSDEQVRNKSSRHGAFFVNRPVRQQRPTHSRRLSLMRRYLHPSEFLAYVLKTFARLVVGGMVIAFGLFLLLCLLALVLGPGHDNHQLYCLSNLKQLGTALSMYVQDYDETYPAADS